MTDRTRGIACIIASAFGFALMAFFVRLADDFGGSLSCFQKSFFRNAIALVIAFWVLVKNRGVSGAAPSVPLLRGKPLVLVSLRSIFGAVGIFANFYALSRIPIGEAMTLNKTAPFFTVFFSFILLKERVSWRQAMGLCLAFCGALLVMKPGFHQADGLAAMWALIGGLGAGLAYVCVHELGRLGVRGAGIVVYFSAFSCLVSIPLMWRSYAPMTVAQLIILLAAGAGAAMGQFGVTAAYRYAEPRAIAAYDYTNVIFTSLLGFAFFGQTPDALSVLGFLVILVAALRLRG